MANKMTKLEKNLVQAVKRRKETYTSTLELIEMYEGWEGKEGILATMKQAEKRESAELMHAEQILYEVTGKMLHEYED